MLCGAGSFSHMDDDHDVQPRPPATPTKKKAASKNPYSARGLDKFSAVLTELESRRRKILSQVGAQGVPVVLRFMYKSTQDWIPVVVKLPPPPPPEKPAAAKDSSAAAQTAASPAAESNKNPAATATTGAARVHAAEEKRGIIRRKRHGFSWGSAVGRPRRQLGGFLYSAIVLAVILLCLAASGRTLAICCTSVLCYVLPGMTEKTTGSTAVRRSMQRRDYVYGRKASDKALGSGDAGGA